MLTAERVGEIIELLHLKGYRLRKLSADSLEVVDESRPMLDLGVVAGQQTVEIDPAEQARVEFEQDKWAHVGGKPPFIRDQPRAEARSPWADVGGTD